MRAMVTVTAPANIAFIKYWGTRDPRRVLPVNPSISMTLGRCRTTTTLAFTPDETAPDTVTVVDERGRATEATGSFRERVVRHLDRMRERAGRVGRFRMATRNSFPTGAGIASSASGFAALTVAAGHALGLDLSPAELSCLARESGSGSAARSLFGGYVEWPSRSGDPEAPAGPIASASHWDLSDVIAVVDQGEKEVSSVEGHRRAPSSPHYEQRQRLLAGGRIEAVRRAIAARDLAALGPLLEEEAIELHIIAMSSSPPIHYWKPATLTVLEAVRGLRRHGARAWATMDAGPNVHVICPAQDGAAVAAAIGSLPGVRQVIVDGVGEGPRLEPGHLL